MASTKPIPHEYGSLAYRIWETANRIRLELAERGDPTGRAPVVAELYDAFPDAKRTTVKTCFSRWVCAHGLVAEVQERQRRRILVGQAPNRLGRWILSTIASEEFTRLLIRTALEVPLPEEAPDEPAADEPARCTARPTLPGPFAFFAAERGLARKTVR